MAFTTVIPAIKWNDNWVQLKEMLASITGLLIDWPPTFHRRQEAGMSVSPILIFVGIIVGASIAGGAIYSGLVKVADAIS
ncbi:MAG: hypothetical protein VCF08_06490 [Alphaproteobacteria bacterium]